MRPRTLRRQELYRYRAVAAAIEKARRERMFNAQAGQSYAVRNHRGITAGRLLADVIRVPFSNVPFRPPYKTRNPLQPHERAVRPLIAR